MEKISENILSRIDNADLCKIMEYHGCRLADKQKDADVYSYFCPFHKSVKYPNFKISKSKRRGGLYNAVQFGCSEKGCTGYGAIALEARFSGLTETGEDLLVIIRKIAEICNIPIPELDEANRNGFVEMCEAQSEYSVEVMDGFTIEGLHALGCKAYRVYRDDNKERKTVTKDKKPVFRYSFGPKYGNKMIQDTNFDPIRLQKEFHLYQVKSYTTSSVLRDGTKVSIKRTAHALFPIFVFRYYAKSEQGELKEWGQIYQPEWNATLSGEKSEQFITYYQGGLTKFKVDATLLGDSVSMRVFGGEFVPVAAKEVNTNEPLVTTRTIIKEGDGESEEIDVDLEDKDIRVTNIILCKNGIDALNAYFHLNIIAEEHDYNSLQRDSFYHVVWMGPKENDFSTFMFTQLCKLATNKFLMLDIDNAGKKQAFRISKRFTKFRAAFLPERLKGFPKEYRGGIYNTCKDIRSFFLKYLMSEEERYGYENDINLLFQSFLTAAIPIEPLVYCEKKDKKSGRLLEYYYRLDSACLWQFMATEGYCREVDHESTDEIGRFVHIDGCFVKELDAKSLLAATGSALSSFAQRMARPGTEDYRKMSNAIINSKEIAEKSAVNLPEMDIDYRSGYGPKLDHFFYRNGVLEITPDSIRFKSYREIDFCVDRAEILPFDFRMPCTSDEPPFTIRENPEYRKKLEELEAHRKDNANYTQDMLKREEQEVEVWAQRNRWLFDFRGKKVEDWWQPLQVLRCFANEEYEKEQELQRTGQQFDEEQEKNLLGHLANIFYSLGRPLFRYRGGGTNYMPYITENGVSKEGRSEGGSGKSVFVNVFMGCAGKICRINSRNLKPTDDISLKLANYIHHCHRVIHWEDWGESLPLDPVYNYITSGFEFRDFHKKAKLVPLKDSPGHVATSNFQQTYEDPSSSGRTVPTGFSHRFNRGDTRRNKPAQKISTVMPGLRDDPEDIEIELRSQMAYLDAMAVQFCMLTNERVLPPMEDLNNRSRIVAMGARFMEWAEEFFSHDHVFYCPIDFETIFGDYVELCQSSEDKKTKFAPAAFRSKIEEYCLDMGYVCLPEVCYSSDTDRKKGFMRVKAWCKETYFDDEKVWGKDKKKEIRILKHSNKCLFFCKSGNIPVDLLEVKKYCKDYYNRPDPDMYLDPDGEPVVLTVEESEQWEAYMKRKQGVFQSSGVSVPTASAEPARSGDVSPQKDLPF